MVDLQKIYDFENEFPRRHAAVCVKPFGRLFHAAGNPMSHDSNHAIILDLECDLPRALDEIVRFYDAMDIAPRVYATYRGEEEEAKLWPALKAGGFTLKTDESKLFLHRNSSRIDASAPAGLNILKVDDAGSPVLDLMQTGDQQYFGEWSAKVLEQMMRHRRFHLLVGYLGSNPVCMASLYLAGGFSRLDDVLVKKEFRGRGYGRLLVDRAVRYHQSVAGGSALYLWAENPAAVRIYCEAGFEESSTHVRFWSAWKERGQA